MKLLITGLVLVCLVAVSEGVNINVFDRKFNHPQQCGKKQDGAVCKSAETPCCSKLGFCGKTRYHCEPSLGCQSGCKSGVNSGAGAASANVKPIKPPTTRTIIKTISTPIPVCKNCDNYAKAAAKISKELKPPAHEKKIEEETSESVTESKPKPSPEKKPTCDLKKHPKGCPKVAAQKQPTHQVVVQVTGRVPSQRSAVIPVGVTSGITSKTADVLDPVGY